MKRIILMGFMGAGKTTVGKKLAKDLSCDFIDTDELVEKVQGCKISESLKKTEKRLFGIWRQSF